MKVFLGSSKESVKYLAQIAVWLEEVGVEPLRWDLPTLFPPGENTFLGLIDISQRVDGAVFIFGEDDSVWYRGGTVSQPRDNVLLEYGLFVGVLGPMRAIICRSGNPKAATDLQGINWIDSSPGVTERARIRLTAWAQELVRGQGREDSKDGSVAGSLRHVERTVTGFKTAFRGTGVFVDFGVLEDMPIDSQSAAVVLPANEFFDERCFGDVKTAAGAFIQRRFPNQAPDLQKLVRERLPCDQMERIERPGRPALESFGVGTCAYLDQPLGSRFRLIFAAVATDRPPDGLRTDLSTIFKLVEKIRCIISEERIEAVWLPLLGAGKGGVATDVAFHTMLNALLDARCKDGGHHLKEVHIVVYAPRGRSPQIDQTRVKSYLEHLVALYRNASL